MPLWELGALPAVSVCVRFVASIPQISQADWAGVDCRATWSVLVVLVGSVRQRSRRQLRASHHRRIADARLSLFDFGRRP